MSDNPTLHTSIPFGNETPPESVGMTPSGVRGLVEVFERHLADGWHPGAQLVVLRRGQVVLDRAAGLANVTRRIPVTPDTPFVTFSCTKAFTGMCVHRLIEQGKIELDAPIACYWPEFGCKGKEKATIRHAFLHQAGIPLAGLYTEALLAWNWDWVARTVAGLQAEFEPGTKCAYHLVNYGFILGEVVRRVSGQRIDHFMRGEFFEPLGLKNSYLGIPYRELGRASKIYLGHPEQRMAVTAFNLPWIRGAVIPAASLNSTARDLAVFYQMLLNGGTYAGKQIVKPETVAAATQMGYDGRDDHLKSTTRWAYGFHLGGKDLANPDGPNGMGQRSTERTFGHFGQASCLAWADPDADLVVTFTCNRLLSHANAGLRWAQISEAVWDCV